MDEVRFIGYHGTAKENAKNIIKKSHFNKSNNVDDWLGSGVYFYNTLDNAIMYNIKKYKKRHRKFPKYSELKEEYSILTSQISCKDDEIIDFGQIDELYKFLWAWLEVYDRIKDDERYKRLKFKDGYVINWLINETSYFDNCKLLINVFFLDLTNHNKNINKIFQNKTRIGGYKFSQLYICVLSDDIIQNIEYINKEYEDRYKVIKDLINIY